MDRWTVKTGRNGFRKYLLHIPDIFILPFTKAIRIDLEFLEESAYSMLDGDFLDRDTFDFSKSLVVNFNANPLINTFSSIMLGWNYNPLTQEHWCTVYTHNKPTVRTYKVGDEFPIFKKGDVASLIAVKDSGKAMEASPSKEQHPHHYRHLL